MVKDVEVETERFGHFLLVDVLNDHLPRAHIELFEPLHPLIAHARTSPSLPIATLRDRIGATSLV